MLARFVSSNADCFFDPIDENFAVADLPVLAALTIADVAFSTMLSVRTTSTLIFGTKSTTYSFPR